MEALNQQEIQVVELFRQLAPDRRRYVLLEMTRAEPDAWRRFQGPGEARLRELARQQGLDWEQLDDQSRQDFVERLVDGDGP